MNLVESARVAGASGKSWHDWVMSDEIQDIISAADHFSRADQDGIEKAFAEGRRESAVRRGRIIWTTAPSDYDGADATEMEVIGDYFGKVLRKVAIEPEGYSWQSARYASGTYGVWDKDPIAEDLAAREKYAKADAERAAVEAKHAAGAAWLRTASAAELADEELCWERGATYTDIRAEKTRRHEEEKEGERGMGMARLASLIPEGATLIDDGEYIVSSMVGLRPIQRPSYVYYEVHLVHGWPDDAAHAKVEHGAGRHGGVVAAETLADLIVRGKVRVAKEGEVPPQAVVNRIGVERRKNIWRVEVGGRVVWVGRALFGSEELVLDESGKLVRAKKIVDAAKVLAAAMEAASYAKAPSGDSRGHAWAGPVGPRARTRRKAKKSRGHHLRASRARGLRGRYGRAGGWFGDKEGHSLASRKGWSKRK